MFKDRKVVSGDTLAGVYSHTDLADMSDNCVQEFGVICTSSQLTKLANYGWKFELELAVGEKALSRPITLNGVIYFTTYLPAGASINTVCGPDEGSGAIYSVNLHDGSAAVDNDLSNSVTTPAGGVITLQKGDRAKAAGAGIPADVIAIRKGGQTYALPPGQNYPTAVNLDAGSKTYWYVEGE